MVACEGETAPQFNEAVAVLGGRARAL